MKLGLFLSLGLLSPGLLAGCAVAGRKSPAFVSPSGRVARWTEIDRSAMDDFEYHVEVEADGRREEVAVIEGAFFQNDIGPKLVWHGDGVLEIRYTDGKLVEGPKSLHGDVEIRVETKKVANKR